MYARSLGFALATLLPLSAYADRLALVGSSSSSDYPPEAGVVYDSKRAIDGKLSTAWIEGEEGSGLGSWLEVDLGGERTVQKLKIWGGLWYSSEYWERANRPKDIEVRYSDGSTDSFTLTNEMTPQELQLPKARKTTTVRIRVKSVHSGTTWLDTAISEVQVFDAAAGDTAPVRAIEASSTAPADGDGSYGVANLSDGLSDSMWCEGNAEGDGTGEWLQFEFSGTQQVGALDLVNGIGTSLPYWMKGNRALKATLTFSDGATEQIAIKNSMMPQTVSFPAHRTSSARITFTEVAKGKEFNDLCISEAAFKP